MNMTPSVRKFALTAHVTFSVGWLGAVLAYLPLAIIGLTSPDAQTVRASYLSMESIAWFAIVPCCFAALLSGLAQSLGTDWGLFRHYWVLLKFLLTISATIILLLHMPTITRVSRMAAELTLPIANFAALRTQLLVHATGGLLVLIGITALSVWKPWGMTAYGRSRAVLRHFPTQPQRENKRHLLSPSEVSWRLYLLVGIIGLFLLLVILHLIAVGGPSRH